MTFKHLIVLSLLLITFLPLKVQGKTDLPHEFGDLVPLYPGAQVMETRYTRDSVTVVFASADGYGQVADYYSQTLQEKGWRIHPATKTHAGTEQLQSTKGNVHLILSDRPETRDSIPGFVIQLKYPGGRE